MNDVRYDKSHHAGGTPEARISSRLKNSGAGSGAGVTVQKGESPERTFHNIHEYGSQTGKGPGSGEGGR